jgi:hypothetical protein
LGGDHYTSKDCLVDSQPNIPLFFSFIQQADTHTKPIIDNLGILFGRPFALFFPKKAGSFFMGLTREH